MDGRTLLLRVCFYIQHFPFFFFFIFFDCLCRLSCIFISFLYILQR